MGQRAIKAKDEELMRQKAEDKLEKAQDKLEHERKAAQDKLDDERKAAQDKLDHERKAVAKEQAANQEKSRLVQAMKEEVQYQILQLDAFHFRPFFGMLSSTQAFLGC